MIINVRGTSGSGKSTLIRKVLSRYRGKSTVYVKDRPRPLGYIYNHPGDGVPLALIGHYETDCGGCDTITSIDKIYDLVRKSHALGHDVLFEGLLLSAEVRRTMELHQDNLPLVVIGLDTPIEVCLDSVNARRRGAFERRLHRIEAENLVKKELGHKLLPLPEYRGDVNPRNTQSKFKATENTMRRLGEAGVAVEWHNRDSAEQRLVEILRL